MEKTEQVSIGQDPFDVPCGTRTGVVGAGQSSTRYAKRERNKKKSKNKNKKKLA